MTLTGATLQDKCLRIQRKFANINPANISPAIICLALINTNKVIHSRMNKFLENHKCFYKNQFGFRKKHSTNHALITITEKIRNVLENNQYACGVLLYFQKAFDTVNHRILLSKLEYYGIRGIPHDLIKSYLTNRKHTHIHGVDSNTLTSTHCILQGSVLGPLLFLIYINDMSRVFQSSEMYHFAGDTNLLYSSNSMKKINIYKSQFKVNSSLV